MLDQIEGMTGLESVSQTMATLQTLAEGYRSWDQFDYPSAMAHLNSLRRDERGPRVGIGRQVEEAQDFFAPRYPLRVRRRAGRWICGTVRRNAKPRGRFDDAIARLYRLMEYIAQVQLFNNHRGLGNP